MNHSHSAFARPATLYSNDEVAAPAQAGLTVREYMATEALKPLIASGGVSSSAEDMARAAHIAVQYADALIERLKVPG